MSHGAVKGEMSRLKDTITVLDRMWSLAEPHERPRIEDEMGRVGERYREVQSAIRGLFKEKAPSLTKPPAIVA